VEEDRSFQVKWIDINLIDENPYWRRKVYDESSIAELKASLVQHGQLEPVTVRPKGDRYELAFGHRRLKAVKGVNLPKVRAVVRNLTDEEMLEMAVVENLQREDLNPIDEAEAYKLMQEKLRYTQEVIGIRVGKSQERIANMVSLLKSDPELQDDIRRRILTPAHVEDIMRIPDREKRMEVRQKVVEDKRSRQATRRLVNQILNESEEPKPLPEGTFNIIYADPPWKYDVDYLRCSPDEHYQTMSVDEICKINVPSSDNAVLFLWATNPMLEDALKVMEAWGFKYKTNMVWVKDKYGVGFYFRGQHELLLVGVKGDAHPPAESNRFSSVLHAPVQKHSEKPIEVYEIIEKMYPKSRYLELFARKKREGWEVSGNEV
jgi:ParB/RepB/Spo0J family partition protein